MTSSSYNCTVQHVKKNARCRCSLSLTLVVICATVGFSPQLTSASSLRRAQPQVSTVMMDDNNVTAAFPSFYDDHRRRLSSDTPQLLLGEALTEDDLADDDGAAPENVTICDGINGTVSDAENCTSLNDDQATVQEHQEAEAEHAMLFPFLALFLGTAVYFVQTRVDSWSHHKIPTVPYPAIMFLLGGIMGAASNSQAGTFNKTIDRVWTDLDPKVILLLFLPGLVTKDALSLDLTLFRAAFWQCLIMAFPMLIVVAIMTAACCVYLFPYGWSWNYGLALGSILAATDHAAVSAMLNSVRAPPRLKIHIAGEGMLNDAFAYIAFAFFWDNYMIDYIDPTNAAARRVVTSNSIKKVVAKTIGSLGAGLLFGVGMLFVARLLNRRLSEEENKVEVITTLVVAYLCYYVSEVEWAGSGVVATLTYGLLLNAFGLSLINNNKLLKDLWNIVEHILMTLLFTLGGLIWGNFVFDREQMAFAGQNGRDVVGYSVALFLLSNVIRFLVFFCFFPINAYIGIQTSFKETVFQSFSGLRGTLGIALAMVGATTSVENEEWYAIEDLSPITSEAVMLFVMVGGVAFLSLIINGTFAGYVLQLLGLTESTELRRKMQVAVWSRVGHKLCDNMVELYSQGRFQHVDFAIVQHHVSCTRRIKASQVKDAMTRYENANKHRTSFSRPSVDHVIRYLESIGFEPCYDGEEEPMLPVVDDHDSGGEPDGTDELINGNNDPEGNPPVEPVSCVALNEADTVDRDDWTDDDLRTIFLELLRASYHQLVHHGELAGRQHLLFAIERSLQLAEADIADGKTSLNDWKHLENHYHGQVAIRSCRKWLCSEECCSNMLCFGPGLNFLEMRNDIELGMAFIEAHRLARYHLRNDFLKHRDDQVPILSESQLECRQVQDLLASFPQDMVSMVESHSFSKILLTNAAHHIENYAHSGLLAESEVEHLCEEIQHELLAIDSCLGVAHSNNHDDRDGNGDRATVESAKSSVLREQQPLVTESPAEIPLEPDRRDASVVTMQHLQSGSFHVEVQGCEMQD